ncbi:hypothetical protein RD792_016512 [Penstemon davidsonii]|uniref:CASP-like protein n=1 Tax=Penstemon davidsonii TaxID=160366 RepID=A0ABR0CJL3_9LAMI|nr:hypothetical protein RD792_016512 [Penstemon davidsonii]
MDYEKQKQNATFTTPTQSANGFLFIIAQYILRVFVIAFTLAGAIITATAYESVTVFGIVMDAKYTYSAAFRYKVVADSVVCGVSVLSVVILIALNRPKSNPNNYFYLFLNDLGSLLLLLSGCSSALAIGYVAQFGEQKMGWITICDRVSQYCHKTTAAIVSTFIAVICLLLLTILSAYKLKSTRI